MSKIETKKCDCETICETCTGVQPIDAPKEIQTGSIVKYDNGWYRVRKCTKNTVNLGSIFGSHLYHKGIPKDQVVEDHDAWYQNWQQSDTYRSM